MVLTQMMIDPFTKKKKNIYFWTQAQILCRFHQVVVENANRRGILNIVIMYLITIFNNLLVHYTTLLNVNYFYVIVSFSVRLKCYQ